MKYIIVIIQKEMTDMVRDKRTLFTMIVIPLLLFPLIFSISGNFAEKQQKDNAVKVLKVAVQELQTNFPVVRQLQADSLFKIKTVADEIEADTLVRDGDVDLALSFADGFEDSISEGRSAILYVMYRSTDNWHRHRIERKIKAYESALVQQRIADLGVSYDYIAPLQIQIVDKAREEAKFGQTIGAFIPYLFIIFCFLGCMYPAIDLFAGEKERGTIETLFTLPVTRMQILTGKLCVVALSGLISALLSLIGLFVSINTVPFIPEELLSVISSILNVRVVVMVVLMMIPFSLFIASVLIMFSVYARNYKEAQSSISPMTVLVILPAIVAVMPGVEYNITTALIPIVNISLATKEIISDTISVYLYGITLVSLLAITFLSLWLCSRWFLRENVIMRV